MPERFFPRVGLGTLLVVALALAACGGQPAPTPPGYSCTFANSYCATYTTFSSSNFTGSPPIYGAYANIQNATLICTSACAVSSSAGYIANMLMLVSSDNNSWVESGVWNDGYVNPSQGFLGPGTTLVYGVGTGGIPTYRPINPLGEIGFPIDSIGVEIQLGFETNFLTDNGYLFRYGFWSGGEVSGYNVPNISFSMPNSLGLHAPTVPLTHVEIGEFLHGTSGATAEDTIVYPPLVSSENAGPGLPIIVGGYPNNLYPHQLAIAQAGIQLHTYHSTETLTFPGGHGQPVAVGSPPYGAWFGFNISPYSWATMSGSNPNADLMVFTCCGGSFR
jgi:hypothetical protein